MILHVEQHQAAVAKGVNGAQDERCHQGGEEGAPERLEGEVIAHLAEGETGSERRRGWWMYRIGSPLVTDLLQAEENSSDRGSKSD